MRELGHVEAAVAEAITTRARGAESIAREGEQRRPSWTKEKEDERRRMLIGGQSQTPTASHARVTSWRATETTKEERTTEEEEGGGVLKGR